MLPQAGRWLLGGELKLSAQLPPSVGSALTDRVCKYLMAGFLVPILLFVGLSTLLAVALIAVGGKLGPKRNSPAKEMPYESGMNPIHDARRRFDVRFHLVAIAFLLFDVELLFLYPWAVARKDPAGFPRLEADIPGFSSGMIFIEVMAFVVLLAVGLVYAWRKGVFQWR